MSSRGSGDSTTPRACLLIALAGLALRLALAMRAEPFVDRLFVPDDTYYTLTIARSLARGLGPTMDGSHLTSGFQPLLAFLLVPWIRVVRDPEAAFRAALVLGAIADGLTTWLVGHLTLLVDTRPAPAPRRSAIVASGIWALSATAISTALNGLETSLAIACTLAALAAIAAPPPAPLGSRARAWLRWAAAGLLLGLCLLARVDTCVLVAAALVAVYLEHGFGAAASAAGGALAAVSPWWIYSLARFGTVVPESGAAVREQAQRYQAMGLVLRDQLAWAGGAVTGPPFLESTWLRHALGSGASAVGAVVAVAFVAFAVSLTRARYRPTLRLLALNATWLVSFYALYLPATWFFRRYLAPTHVLVAVVGAIASTRVWDERRSRPRRAWAVAALGILCVALTIGELSRYAFSTPAITYDQGHHGAKGYREPARQALALLPPGAVVGSFQSGALSWFSDGTSVSVVNLDGVVGREAARAVREHRLGAFARARHVTHLADWEVNRTFFLERSGEPALTKACLREIGHTEAQGPDEHFVVYEIAWPPPPP